MAENSGENIFERMQKAEDEARAREAAQNVLTDQELQEVARINRKFEDVGDIRLMLIRDWAEKWDNRWSIIRNSSVLLAVGGEVIHMIGNKRGSNRLSAAGRYIQIFGLVTAGFSIFAADYSESEARDAQIESAVRDIR